ncbi:MAG: glycosyltransferase, partial [Acholeplasmatales bacterium]|nr:glycosyltransferase [Acholeplasmatales bacterium]
RNDKKDLIKILTIGRYSKEKRQDTLLKAINKSKYKDNIKVILAGKGPRERHLKKLAKKYRLNCQFSFFSQEELIKKIEKSVLYIHPAEAEIEGISALEAIASGLVPIVAKSKQSATQKFTLTEESLFKVRDYQELAQKIDYFIDFYERRKHLEAKYRNYLRNYQIEKSISLLEEFFKETIYDYKRRQAAHSKQGKRIKKSIVKTRKGRAASFLFYYFFAMPVLMFYFILIRGLRIKGKKNLKKIKNGAIFISNHVHKLDSAMGGLAAFPKKPIFTSLPSNFQIPIVGSLVHILGASPIPATPLETKIFFTELKDKLVKGRYVHFFPEGELITKSEEIREFKRGAFMLAEEAKVPIVPLRINFIEKERRIHYPFFMKDKIELLVGKPIYPNIFLPKRAAIDELQTRAIAAMQQLQ